MYGFYITMGMFGSGKTQNMTKYLRDANPHKITNISNYWTGYTDFQVQSHRDLISILTDIYDYHQYINLYDERELLYSHKPHLYNNYCINAQNFRKNYPNLPKNLSFNIALDEGSIYFNPRNFDKNFKGENEKLLDFIYQPRKLNCLFMVAVQNPLELDVKFRRLAGYYRKYYRGLHFIRWHKDFYFPNPEEMDFEKAEVIGWGVNFNFYPLFPRYQYNTKELIRVAEDIYRPHSLFQALANMDKPFRPSKVGDLRPSVASATVA
ncbi:MAG: hypothetical protein PHU93_01115 [Candidatus Gracilibacteria bacterium]|nr:hypothetical protein [Candidatus Gracilibacteria bacterium]